MKLIDILKNEYCNRYGQKKNILLRSLLCYYRDPDFRVLVLIRYLTRGKYLIIRKMAGRKLLVKYSVAVSRNCKIGENLKIAHFLGLVIGSGAVIGDNCEIYHQVTIGKKNNGYPIIGNNVKIYTGAKIIGNIRIGDNAIIGANSVVLKDIPKNSTAVGIPAKIIK